MKTLSSMVLAASGCADGFYDDANDLADINEGTDSSSEATNVDEVEDDTLLFAAMGYEVLPSITSSKKVIDYIK